MPTDDADKTEARRLYDRIQQKLSSMSEEERSARVASIFGTDFGTGPPIRYKQTSEKLAVPEELRVFLIDVDRRIEEGDEATTIPSDDLLQCKNAVGGLVAGQGRFSFVYFPERDSSVRWKFTLLPAEIKEISRGDSEITVQRFERL